MHATFNRSRTWKHFGLAGSTLLVLALYVLAALPATAFQPGNQHFLRTWERTDRPVLEGISARTWMWGPEANYQILDEPYVEAPGGSRQVQYFDKARMEIVDPTADPDSIWYVTNGLLVVELVSGQMQVGDDTFEERTPAAVNVAGDADDPTGPTYASFQALLDDPPQAIGGTITARIDRSGNVANDPALEAQGVTVGYIDEVTNHAIATPFWDFMNSNGTVYENGQFVDSQLFENAFFATGRPITEAYWASVKVGGQYRDVLMQCFERRCLTNTPGNPEGFIVEAGNVGQHYYAWRYPEATEEESEPTPTPTEAEPTATATEPKPTPTEEPSPTPTGEPSPTPEPATEYEFTHAWGEKSNANGALSDPADVAVAPNGNVYIIDQLDRVLAFSPDGVWIKGWGSTGSDPGEFDRPRGIAVDANGFVYVAEFGNQRIQKFDADGALITHWTLPGYPSDIAVGETGRVYVSNEGNHKVWVFQSDGTFIDDWGEYGGGPGQLYIPMGIDVGPDGNIYIADTGNNRFQVFTPEGDYLGGYGSKGEGAGQFKSPADIVVLSGGPTTLGPAVYVSDSANHRIQVFRLNQIATMDSERTLAAAMSFSYSSEFGTRGSEDGEFDRPAGLARDAGGRLYVADINNDRMQTFGQSFTGKVQHLDSWYDDTRGRFDEPGVLDIGPDGRVYAGDFELAQVQVFTPDGVFVDQWRDLTADGMTFDSQGVLHLTNREETRIEQRGQDGILLGAWEKGSSTFLRLSALTVDAEDNVYVLQPFTGSVQKFAADGTYLDSWGAPGSQAGQFATPTDVAVHGNSIYVVDQKNHRVQQFDLEGNFIRLWGEEGSSEGQFDTPSGVAVDSDGYVYVTDTANHRIQKFTPDGEYLTQWGSVGSGEGQFSGPTAIAIDPDGNVYVADFLNRRIQVFQPAS